MPSRSPRQLPRLALAAAFLLLPYFAFSARLTPAARSRSAANAPSYAAEMRRLRAFLPRGGYDKLARQDYKVMEWNNMPGMDKGRAFAISQVVVNLGPTGILAHRDRKALVYTVVSVAPDSPAAGKLEPGDAIIGLDGKLFADIPGDETFRHHFPNLQFGWAVERAESRSDGRLRLLVRRGKKRRTVTLHLLPLGAFGSNFPGKNAKSDFLIEVTARILAAKQLDSGWWDVGYAQKKCRYPAGRPNLFNSCLAGLALIAADQKKYEANVRKLADVLIADPKDHFFQPWKICYRGLFLGEYYLHYRDERARKKLAEIARDAIDGAMYYEGTYGWAHHYGGGDYSYGGICMTTSHALMALAMARRCGIDLGPEMDRALVRTIERISPDGKIGYVPRPAPRGTFLPIRPFNQDAGRTGMGAIAYRLLGGRRQHVEKMLAFLEANEKYNDSCHGGGHEFSWVWSTLALGILDEAQYRRHLRKWLWYLDFNRMYNFGWYVQPDPACVERRYEMFGPNYLAATYTIILAQYRHNLAITGNPIEMPRGEAYRQPALSAYDMALRYKHVLRAACAIALFPDRAPRSFWTLLEDLRGVPREAPNWRERVDAVYANDLRPALEALAALSAPAPLKAQAAMLLLGIDYHAVLQPDAKKQTFALRQTFYPANTGDYQLGLRLVLGNAEFRDPAVWIRQHNEREPLVRRALEGVDATRGISIHAPGEMTYEIGGGYRRLTAAIGLANPYRGEGSVTFEVIGDGKCLYRSPVITGNDLPRKIDVDIRGVKRLRLITTDAGDGKRCDHSIWFDPRLVGRDGKPHRLRLADAESASAGWAKPTQDRHFDGRALDRQLFPRKEDRRSAKSVLKIEDRQAAKLLSQGRGVLFVDFSWHGLRFSLPIVLQFPLAPIKKFPKSAIWPGTVIYGPLHGRLLRLGPAVRLQLPGRVLFESDATGLTLTRNGVDYDRQAYVKKFGEVRDQPLVSAWHCFRNASPFKGVFLRLLVE